MSNILSYQLFGILLSIPADLNSFVFFGIVPSVPNMIGYIFLFYAPLLGQLFSKVFWDLLKEKSLLVKKSFTFC